MVNDDKVLMGGCVMVTKKSFMHSSAPLLCSPVHPTYNENERCSEKLQVFVLTSEYMIRW